MKVVAFVPVKLNNERLPGKNIKKFCDGTPLLHCILNSLTNTNTINEVYVYCSKDEITKYLINGVKFLKRDEKYDSSNADVNDMFYNFSKTIDADIYVLAHATAPFLKSNSIDNGVIAVKNGEYDSAISVRKMQEFLWKDGKPFNYDTLRIPRTQDLEPLFVETTGLYIFTKYVIQNRKSRIGNKPFMLEVSPIEAIDINNPIDFEIADFVYSGLSKFDGD